MRRLSAARHPVVTVVFALGFVLLLQAVAAAATDIFQNVGPEPQVINGLADKWPLGNYDLDTHVTAIDVSLTGGVKTHDLPAAIAGFLASGLWKLTAFLSNAVISLLTFAFSLDLVGGSEATGGAGALQPIADATRNIYTYTFGAEWMVVGVVLAAFWAMWRALVQRRFAEVGGAIAMSIVFAVIALGFIFRPDLTVGEASKWSNRMSASVLSISKTGEPTSEQQAKRDASDQLFKLLVFDPWVVLNFGGIEHCVKTGGGDDPESLPVRPLASNAGRDEQLRKQLAEGTQIAADGKTCINNGTKYAAHFLRWSPGDLKRSNDEDREPSAYNALRHGSADELPDADPDKARAQFGPEDKPAADAMQAGGQFDRLVMSIVIFLGSLGAILLLGALSVGVMLAQVVVLLLLAFTPIVLVLAILPGRGHQLFLGWLSRMTTFLLRKFLYSLVIAVLLAVGAALTTASANLGWFMAFGLQATFFWSIFFFRRELVSQVNAAITGTPGVGGDVLRKLQGAYYGGQIFRRPVGLAAGAAVGAATLPATAGYGLWRRHKGKQAAERRRDDEREQARGDRQDLADRIAAGLRPEGDESGAPRRAERGNLPLVGRVPVEGSSTSTTTRSSRNGTTDGQPDSSSRPGDRQRPEQPSRGPDGRPRTDGPGGAPEQPGQPGSPSKRPDRGPGRTPSDPPRRPSRRDRPVSASEILAEDAERLRRLREKRNRKQEPPPPQRPDDEDRR